MHLTVEHPHNKQEAKKGTATLEVKREMKGKTTPTTDNRTVQPNLDNSDYHTVTVHLKITKDMQITQSRKYTK